MVLKQEVIDAFNVLGLQPNVEQYVASTAYKKLALKHHPDRNYGDPSAHERFQEVGATSFIYDGDPLLIFRDVDRSAKHGQFVNDILTTLHCPRCPSQGQSMLSQTLLQGEHIPLMTMCHWMNTRRASSSSEGILIVFDLSDT